MTASVPRDEMYLSLLGASDPEMLRGRTCPKPKALRAPTQRARKQTPIQPRKEQQP